MQASSRPFASWFVCLLATTALALSVKAQVNPYKDGTPGFTGYRSEIMAEVLIQEDKFTRLAEAIPPKIYLALLPTFVLRGSVCISAANLICTSCRNPAACRIR